MLKRFFLDPSLWILIAFNGYCIVYYNNNPGRFNDIVWLYWGQSVLIGIFNFLDLLTIRNVIPGSMTIGDKPVTNSSGNGCAAFFFLLHYQFFHVVYFIFLAISYHGNIDFQFVLLGLAVVSFELLVNFIRHKIQQRTMAVNIGKMFFLPYLRIIPMHLMILLPAFLGINASFIFLFLKMIADLIMYLITTTIKTNTASPIDTAPHQSSLDHL